MAEAKRSDAGAAITVVEGQPARYANSRFKWVKENYTVRFVYEATDELTRFTDYLPRHQILLQNGVSLPPAGDFTGAIKYGAINEQICRMHKNLSL